MNVQMSSGVTELQRALPVGVRARGAARRELIERDRVGGLPGHPDHVLELRASVADLADLVHLVVVLDDHGDRVGVLEHVLALLGGVRLVDRHHRRPGGERREVEIGPLGPRVRENRDLVALLDPEVDQAQRQRPDRLPDLVVGARLPAAPAVVVEDRSLRSVLADGDRQQLGEGARPGRRLRGRLGRRRRLHQLLSSRGLLKSPGADRPGRKATSAGRAQAVARRLSAAS